MKVYHGSKYEIEKPVVSGSNYYNDYGPAFYLTADLDSANEWACKNGAIGVVNEYELNLRGLKILDLREHSVLNWLAILMHYRELEERFIKSFAFRLDYLEKKYYIDVKQFDVVIGYRADDAYFRFPLDFLRGNITLEQLEDYFVFGNLGIQYALISEKAFSHLKYIKCFDSNSKYLNRYFNRVREATQRFDELNKDSDGIRIQDIIKDKS